jgi:hypothetical protein
MDRRSFLKALGGTAAAAVAVPALVLPVRAIALSEPARKFYLPPEQGWPYGRSPLADLGQSMAYLNEAQPRYTPTYYRITGFYDPDNPLPQPGETVLLNHPHAYGKVRAMVTEYTTEMRADNAATISVKFVTVPDGPEPTTEVNMRRPISWTTWHEPFGSRTERAGNLPNWS